MRKLALAALAAVLVVGAGITLVFFLRPSHAREPAFEAALSAADVALAGGYLPAAREALSAVPALPNDEEDLLRILKRAFAVSSGSGDYSFLADMAGRASRANTRSARIRAVSAYAEMRTGRVAQARQILSRGRLPADIGDLLRGEVILRTGGSWQGSDGLTRDLMRLESSRNPAAYASAALRTGDRGLSLDAALLHMAQGSPGAAGQIVLSALVDAPFDEPASFILYDAGDFKGALSRLQRLNGARPGRAAIELFLADIYQSTGSGADSERWLRNALPLAPAASWTEYLDLAWFASGRGDTAQGLRLLADGKAFFPNNRGLRIAEARLALAAGNVERSLSVLSALVAANPADAEAGLFLLSLQASTMSPEAHRARLWKLFNRVPENVEVFHALCMSLLAARDWEGAQVAVSQHEAAGGTKDGGVSLVAGLAAAMKGDDARAIEAFGRSADLLRDGVARYDLALVLLRSGRIRDALSELDAAQDQFERRGDLQARAQTLARIEMLRGSARLLQGDEQGALAALQRAKNLDPRNLRAGLLLRKLEAGGQ